MKNSSISNTGTKTRTKYEILNDINERYNLYPCEITSYEEAQEFFRELQAFYIRGNASDSEFDLALLIIDNWNQYA